MLHITSFDYVLMIIILLVVFIKQIQSMCCVVKEKFLVFSGIMLGLVIAGALGEFDSVSKDCIVKNTDFFKTFKTFKKVS